MVPVVSEDNKIMGVVTEGNLMACLLNGRVQPEDIVESVMYKQFKKVSDDKGDVAQRWSQQRAGIRLTRFAPVVCALVTSISIAALVSERPTFVAF